MKNWLLNINLFNAFLWVGVLGASVVTLSIIVGVRNDAYMQGYSDGAAATVALIPKKAPRQLDTVYIDTLEGRWKI